MYVIVFAFSYSLALRVYIVNTSILFHETHIKNGGWFYTYVYAVPNGYVIFEMCPREPMYMRERNNTNLATEELGKSIPSSFSFFFVFSHLVFGFIFGDVHLTFIFFSLSMHSHRHVCVCAGSEASFPQLNTRAHRATQAHTGRMYVHIKRTIRLRC